MEFKGRILTQAAKYGAGLVDSHHLGNAMLNHRDVLDSVMMKLFTTTNYQNDSSALLSSLYNIGKETIKKSEWEYELKVDSKPPLVVVEKSEEAGLSKTVGRGGSKFSVILDENWHTTGDMLSPGNPQFQCRVMSEPIRQGNGYKYTCQLMSSDSTFGIPSDFFEVGALWSKMFSPYEEGTSDKGSTTWSTSMAFKSKMSMFRKGFEMTGEAALTDVLLIALVEQNKFGQSTGRFSRTWLSQMEVSFWNQWKRELEIALWYSRYNENNLKGSTGRVIKLGAGVHQQLEDGHKCKYNKLTARLLEEFLMDIFYARVLPDSPMRDIDVFTGEIGLLEFNRCMRDIQQKRGLNFVDSSTVMRPVSSPYNSNAYEYGYQFTSYNIGNRLRVTPKHAAVYDNTEIHMDKDPVTGYPKESMRYTLLDSSGIGINKNIRLIEKENSFKYGYVHGLTDMNGPVQGRAMSTDADVLSFVVQKEQGIQILDPSRCGELILNR